MAAKTGSVTLAGHIAMGNVMSIGINTSSNEFPCGTVTFNNLGMWYLKGGASPGVTYTFGIYLCNGGGGNAIQICTVNISGSSSYTGSNTLPTTGSCPDNSASRGLSGASLYMFGQCIGISENDSSANRATATGNFQLRTEGCTVTINTANSYGASTFSASNVDFGKSSKVSISNANISALTHKVTWTLTADTSKTYTTTTSKGATSASYTIPESWISSLSSTSVAATVKIEVVTYNGSQKIGSTATKNITVSVPSTVVPTLGSLSAAVYWPSGEVSGFSGKYIQSNNGVKITFNNAKGIYGSTISSYTLTSSPSESMSRSSNVFTVNRFVNKGTIKFTGYVTDSRGRKSATKTVSINVLEYTYPTIKKCTATRCTSDRTPSETGTYATLSATYSYANISGNTATVNSVYYKASGTKTTAKNNMASGTEYLIGGGNLDPNYTYYVDVTITDTLGGSYTATKSIASVPYAIHVKNGGNGVAFGKISERNKCVEIAEDWNLYFRGTPIGISRIYHTARNPHIYSVPTSSGNFIIFSGAGVTRTWIGYVFCSSAGVISVLEVAKGSNATIEVDNTEGSATKQTIKLRTYTDGAADSQVTYLKIINVRGSAISDYTS